MVEIFGEYYYIDLDKVTQTSELEVETVEPKEGEEDSIPRYDQTINVFKYDIVKQCIDTLLTEGNEEKKLRLIEERKIREILKKARQVEKERKEEEKRLKKLETELKNKLKDIK